MNLDYKTIYSKEACGNSYGTFGIQINVAASKLPDLKHETITSAVYDAVKLVESAVLARILAENPKTAEKAKQERDDLLALFNNPIYVEEIPNGYCPDWCCKHLPWFIVTTPKGRIKIGWRKSVIQIDWSQATVGMKTAEQLFPDEDVTRDMWMIHAHSLEKAKQYLDAILK